MADDMILRPGAVALVTGASAGIGEAIGESLVERERFERRCRHVCERTERHGKDGTEH